MATLNAVMSALVDTCKGKFNFSYEQPDELNRQLAEEVYKLMFSIVSNPAESSALVEIVVSGKSFVPTANTHYCNCQSH